MIDRARFDVLYQQCVTEVMERMPDDWSAFAKHNIGWRKDRFDAEGYLPFLPLNSLRSPPQWSAQGERN